MLGDVSGAFRHIPVSADHAHMFAFKFDGYLAIDLSCGFGWCGSPAFYSVAGALINGLYESQRPQSTLTLLDSNPFAGNVWCDDHTCVEPGTGSRSFWSWLSKAGTTVVCTDETDMNAWRQRSWYSVARPWKCLSIHALASAGKVTGLKWARSTCLVQVQ